MGYYVDTQDVKILIKKEDFDAIYKRMCELNDHDELKRGGSFPSNHEYEGKYNPNKWFSWMDYNYPETCKDLPAILMQLGFEVYYNDNGDINSLMYSNKTGSEEYFLACFAGYTPDGSYIEFTGEEPMDQYRFYYENGKCYYQRADIKIDYVKYQEEIVPGQITDSDKAHLVWLENYRKELAAKQAQ